MRPEDRVRQSKDSLDLTNAIDYSLRNPGNKGAESELSKLLKELGFDIEN